MKLNEVTQQVDLNKIKDILDKYEITNYTINNDGTVDVDGDGDFSTKKITSIPVRFRNVTGYFSCSHTNITSLFGSPQSVGRDFSCSYTNITSLAGGPQTVGHDFYCSDTKITSLAGAPQSVGRDFACQNTKITSLSGVHKLVKKINGEFSIDPHYTHILGLLLIPGVSYIEANDQKLTNILNKHLKDKNIILAQDELLEAGFTQQAKL